MRNKSLMWMVTGSIVAVSLIVGACVPAAPAPVVPPEVPEEVPEKEAVKYNVVGGTIGGTGHLKANVIAHILKEYENIDSTVMIIPGEGHLPALQDGIADISGFVYPYTTYWAYTATGEYEGREPFTELRLLLPQVANFILIHVPLDSDIRTFKDLVGKRISTGQKGMFAESTFNQACEALGLDPDNDFSRVYLSHAEAGAALIAGKIDAIWLIMTPPVPDLVEVDLRCPLRLIGFSEEDVAAIKAGLIGFPMSTIPAKYYHMDEAVASSITILASFGTTSRLPEDMAYCIVKNYIENPEVAGYFHSSFPPFLTEGHVENWVKTADLCAPYHVGALRYYREIGWDVPEEMIPPEAK